VARCPCTARPGRNAGATARCAVAWKGNKTMNKQRRLALTGMVVAPWLLTACARPTVPTQWYELRSQPPGPVPAARPGDGALWEVASTVGLPGALDRETLVVASG